MEQDIVVVLKLNRRRDGFKDLKENEWDKNKQEKLENYLRPKLLGTSDIDGVVGELQWPFLKNYLNVSDVRLVQLKVDAIYEDLVKIRPKMELPSSTILSQLRDVRSEAYRDVLRWLENLNLRAFDEMRDVNESVIEDEGGKSEEAAYFEGERKVDGKETAIKETPRKETSSKETPLKTPVKETAGTQHEQKSEPSPLTSPLSGLKPLMREPTSSARKLSLELMHMNESKYGLCEINRKTTHTAQIALSRPASTSTSNINVLTRPSILSKSPPTSAKREKAQVKDKFLDVRRKIKLTFSKEPKKAEPTNPLEQLGNRLKNKEVTEGDSRDTNTRNILAPEDANINMLKKTRRTSLVGEQLPQYIRQQLDTGGKRVPRSAFKDDGSDNVSSSISTKRIHKKPSRLQNILANSELLYAHSKDPINGSKPNEQDDTRTSSTISASAEGDGMGTEDQSDEDIGQSDEYILPNSLTRYYAIESEGDIQGANRQIDDISEFIRRAGSYDHAASEEEEEEEEGGDNEEDYLFK